jgi:hypothetical protein
MIQQRHDGFQQTLTWPLRFHAWPTTFGKINPQQGRLAGLGEIEETSNGANP